MPSSSRALLSVAAAPGVDGCPGVAYTRHAPAGGRLPRFLDGAAVCSSVSFGCRRAPTYSPRNGRHTRSAAQRRAVASTLLPSGLTAAASTASPRQRWPRAYATSLPGAAMFCSSLPGTVGAPVSVCNIMASLHTTATFPGKVKVHLRRLSMRVYCVWMGLANSLLRAGGRGTRQRTLAYSSENAPATPARVNRNTMFRISSGRSVCNQLLDADRTPKPRGNFRRQTSPASGRLKLRNISSVSSEFNSSDHRLKFYLCSCTAWSVSACFFRPNTAFWPCFTESKILFAGVTSFITKFKDQNTCPNYDNSCPSKHSISLCILLVLLFLFKPNAQELYVYRVTMHQNHLLAT